MATIQQIDQEQELKERLFHQIETIHDLNVLRGVCSMIEKIASGSVYVPTQDEEEMLEKRLKSLDAGNGIPNETVQKELREWMINHPKLSR